MHKVFAFFSKYPRWTALIAGAVSAAGFEPWGVWSLTLLCFALLIQVVGDAPNKRRAAMIGWLFGVGHFSVGNNWIAVAFTFQAAMPIWLGYFAVVILALYLAVYPAIAAGGAWWVNSHAKRGAKAGSHIPLILAFAGCWTISEWLRSWAFTGFAWNPLAVVWQSQLELARATSLLGTYGLSAVVVATSGLILLAGHRQWRPLLTGVAVLAGLWLYGLQIPTTPRFQKGPRLNIVQPDISQADKYEPGYEAINFAKLAMNSRRLPDQGPRLLLWPEAALPDYLEDGYPYRYYYSQPGNSAAGARARLTTLMQDGDVLVTGANRLVIEKGRLVAARNSVSALDSNGTLLGHYDKAHLVPYGEYLPAPWLLRPLGLARLVPGDLDFWPGPGPQTLTVKVGDQPVKVGIQICYEIIFSGQVVDSGKRPDFIFNPSNDAWFGTIGPPQHLAQARLRAIEEGLPVVRATPTGISAIIDANGRIVQRLALGTAGRIDARLPVAKAPTLFATYGNILPVGFALLLIAGALLPLARHRTSR
ncbi:apolipoprotein N-acyltransferase [Sphingorhabdus sp.]|uniref:apolipoprotein N-acyltransferase n=1 Tax=Sphingorhabdus sp. TaxID=1902408 RepID=UPI0035937CD3